MTDQVARPLGYTAAQNLVPMLRNPHKVVLHIEDRVRARPVIGHASFSQHVTVEWDEAAKSLTSQQVVEKLQAGDPPIHVQSPAKANSSSPSG